MLILLGMFYVVIGIIWTVHCIKMELNRSHFMGNNFYLWIWTAFYVSLGNFIFWPYGMWWTKKKYGKLEL